MTDSIDYSLAPDSPSERADIERPIREALKDNPLRARVNLPFVKGATLPALRLDLEACSYSDGTPIWDKPMAGENGTIVATRADGKQQRLTTASQDWDALTDQIVAFMDGWTEQQALKLTKAREAAERVRKLTQELNNARHEERSAAIDAARGGASSYVLAKIMQRSNSTVGKWVN